MSFTLFHVYGLIFMVGFSNASLCEEGSISHRNCRLLPREDQCGVVNRPAVRNIVGGDDAALGQFPWIARITYSKYSIDGEDEGEVTECVGSIINERYVVSAAHCHEKRYNRLRIRATVHVGEYNTRTATDCTEDNECAPPAQEFEVDHYIFHKNYTRGWNNHILLYRLKYKIDFNKYVSPICLPTDSRFTSEKYLGKKFLVSSGWGIYKQGSMEDVDCPDILQTVSLQFVPLEECRKIWLQDQFPTLLPDDVMCAGGKPGQDTCKGDSGGPLVAKFSLTVGDVPRYYIVGVLIGGKNFPCGQEGYPSFYVDVTKYTEWILNRIKE